VLSKGKGKELKVIGGKSKEERARSKE